MREVVLGMGYDKRIGFEFLKPGPGLGRQLLPEGLAGARAHRRGRRLRLRPPPGRDRRSTTSSSSGWPTRSSAWRAARSRAARSRVWGLTFKARTDDLRDSPSLEVIAPARSDGAPRCGPTTRRAVAARRPRRHRGASPTPTRACEGADVLVVLTEWDEFRWLDFDKVAGADGRRRASSTPATCSTRRRCGGGASTYDGHRPVTLTAAGSSSPAAPGFLGSHLCRRAARPRATRSSPSTTSITGRARQHRATSSATTGFTFVEHDVSNYVARARARSTPCCTSPARRRPRTTSSIPIQTLKVGSLGTHNTLGLAKDKGARFFLASTSEVYGDPLCTRRPRRTGAT